MSKIITIRVGFAVLALGMTCGAADQPAPRSPEPAGWWLKSSLSQSPLPSKTFYHFQGTFSFMNAQGNTEGSSFDPKGELSVRRWRFTSRFLGEYIRRKMTYGGGGGSVNTTESTVRNHMTLDVYKWFSVVGGVEDYRNTLMFMDRRLTFYGGAGAQVVQREKHQVHFVAGIGQSDFRFERDAMMRINPYAVEQLKTTNPDSGGMLLMQNWNWKITPLVTLRQDGSYMDFIEAELGNRWTLGFDVNVAMSRKFSIAVGYHAKHEDNAFIRALHVKPYDRGFTTGIRVTL